jgi:hypothetical protein
LQSSLLRASKETLNLWRDRKARLILIANLRFSLSYRDVEELLAERGLHADHVTVWRWVQRYAPEMERRLRSRLKPTNGSWRVDETYIRVKLAPLEQSGNRWDTEHPSILVSSQLIRSSLQICNTAVTAAVSNRLNPSIGLTRTFVQVFAGSHLYAAR